MLCGLFLLYFYVQALSNHAKIGGIQIKINNAKANQRGRGVGEPFMLRHSSLHSRALSENSLCKNLIYSALNLCLASVNLFIQKTNFSTVVTIEYILVNCCAL